MHRDQTIAYRVVFGAGNAVDITNYRSAVLFLQSHFALSECAFYSVRRPENGEPENGLGMHFDALTLAAVADELKETVAGGRVQQIVLPDSRSVALEIYAHRERRHLLLSAHPQASRVHLLEHKPRRGVPKETPLLLLLRKYVRSARLEIC